MNASHWYQTDIKSMLLVNNSDFLKEKLNKNVNKYGFIQIKKM